MSTEVTTISNGECCCFRDSGTGTGTGSIPPLVTTCCCPFIPIPSTLCIRIRCADCPCLDYDGLISIRLGAGPAGEFFSPWYVCVPLEAGGDCPGGPSAPPVRKIFQSVRLYCDEGPPCSYQMFWFVGDSVGFFGSCVENVSTEIVAHGADPVSLNCCAPFNITCRFPNLAPDPGYFSCVPAPPASEVFITIYDCDSDPDGACPPTGTGTGTTLWYCWHDPDNITNNRCSQTQPGPGWTISSGPYATCAECAGSCPGDTVCP